jgi:calcium-dependent protein kinase
MGICSSTVDKGPNNIDNKTKEQMSVKTRKNRMSVYENGIKINSNLYVGKSEGAPTENYSMVKRLGEGSYGVVWKVKHLLTGHDRAMKKINKSTKTKKETEQEIMNEIEILRKMDHPHIVKIFEFFNTPEGYFLITEFCTGGELFQEVADKAPFSEYIAANIMFQIFSAVNYCHNLNIVHRDLKPENILIESSNSNGTYNLKIIDFGTAKIYEKNKAEKKVIGSSYYIAPEVLNKDYNEKCDIWSCGVILYILLSGRAPFSGDNDNAILNKIKKGTYDLKRTPFNRTSMEAKDLIRKLLEKNPKRRISAGEALKHAWFKKLEVKKNMTDIDEELLKNTILNLKKYNPEYKLQQAVLAYLVHNFPQIEEIKEVSKVFTKFDEDCDGKLTRQEMIKGISNALNINKKEATEMISEIFNIIDNDNNGSIEFEEFIRAGLDKEIFCDEEILRFAFDYFDKDGSGQINIDELRQIFCVGPNSQLAEATLLACIADIDQNGNGEIDFDEFAEMMARIINPDWEKNQKEEEEEKVVQEEVKDSKSALKVRKLQEESDEKSNFKYDTKSQNKSNRKTKRTGLPSQFKSERSESKNKI